MKLDKSDYFSFPSFSRISLSVFFFHFPFSIFKNKLEKDGKRLTAGSKASPINSHV